MEPTSQGRTFGEGWRAPDRNQPIAKGSPISCVHVHVPSVNTPSHPPSVGNSIATMLIPKADRKAIHEVWNKPSITSRRGPIETPKKPNQKKSEETPTEEYQQPKLCPRYTTTDFLAISTAQNEFLVSQHLEGGIWLIRYVHNRPSSVRESSWPRRSKLIPLGIMAAEARNTRLMIILVQLQPRPAPRDSRQEPLCHQGYAVPDQPWLRQDSVLLAILWVTPGPQRRRAK